METVGLTEGAIVAICTAEGTVDMQPVVQVAEIRKVNTKTMNNTERYRLLLSDGVHILQGMLATQQNNLVNNGELQMGSVVQLYEFICNNILNRKIVIITQLEVIQQTCPIIGEPKQYPLPGASVSPSGGQTEVNRAPVPGPTYLTTESGRLSEPKLESDAELQSYGRPSTVNQEQGHYAVSSGTCGGVNDIKTNISGPPSSIYTTGPQQQPPRIVPIAALNPYQSQWTIKARVTAKGELRNYNNARGVGKVFSFDLLDSDRGEIRVTCFNAVVDKFYKVIEVGKVYLISKGSIKAAQKKFNHLPNDHEIVLDTTSTVQPCHDDDSKIPRLQFHFRPISDIVGLDINSFLDVIGVVTAISPTATIMKKDGTETQKRSLQLRDMSCRSVEFTMWGNFCNSEGQMLQNLYDSGNFPVLALKAVKVVEFNGKLLGSISSSQLFIEPDNPEARELKLWFDREGRNKPYVSISRETTSFGKTDVRKTISQIKDENLGTSEKADWITVCATLSSMKMDNFCYTACPLQIGDRQCNKKVVNNGDGKWRCDRCDQSVDECDYRYILQFQIQDHTGLTWVTVFQECGEELLGMSAKDLFDLKYVKEDEDEFQKTVRAALFRKYIFKLKVKEETFNDERRVKSTVVKAEKVDFAAESKFLSDIMQKLTNGDSGLHAKQESISPNIGTGSSTSECFKCQQVGHFARDCPGLTSGGKTGSSTSQCFKCEQVGHFARDCPGLASGGTLQCFKCQQVGHFARDCPGLSSVPPAYGRNVVTPGRYGGGQVQNVGGF